MIIKVAEFIWVPDFFEKQKLSRKFLQCRNYQGNIKLGKMFLLRAETY